MADIAAGNDPQAEAPPTREWKTAREALGLIFSRQILRRTLVIALVVGTFLSLVNQAHVVAGDHATAMTWLRIAANYLTPFVVSSIGALSATHR